MQRVLSSAPGKVILLGEHSVVYGEPAVSASIDLRLSIEIDPTRPPEDLKGHPYLEALFSRILPSSPPSFSIRSEIPPSSGLGSSAALLSAMTAALLFPPPLPLDRARVAFTSFEAESQAQGGMGSPTDTTTVTVGGYVLVDREKREGFLWSVEKGERKWYLHSLRGRPSLPLVVVHSGKEGITRREVEKVRLLLQRDPALFEVVRELGALAREGVDKIERGDPSRLGDLFNEAQRRLRLLGVSTREIEEALELVLPYSFGAKITGAGGGGCIIALPQDPEGLRRALERSGLRHWWTKIGGEGVRVG